MNRLYAVMTCPTRRRKNNAMIRRGSLLRQWIVAALILFVLASAFCEAAEIPQHTAIRAKTAGGKNMEMIEANCDDFFLSAMEEWHIPGLSFSLVHNGVQILAKGYGYSDLEQEKQVKADRSVFRVGALSNLITATACMQLSEARKLYLYEDLNSYLKDVAIPQYESKPVNTWNLLSHTAGFDGRFLQTEKASAQDLEDFGPYLARRLPQRIQAPGEVLNYSDFGMTLAAYVAESVAEMPFAQYVDRKICAPLGMSLGGFRQPLPPELAKRLAVSYHWNGSQNVMDATAKGASQLWPAQSFAATATDMGLFMQAQLGLGSTGGKTILSIPSARGLQRRQFIADPHLIRGHALGFGERRHRGKTVLWQTGQVQGFSSQFLMLPTAKLGIVVLANGDQGDKIWTGVMDLVGDLFLKKRSSKKQTYLEMAPAILKGLSGSYLPVRRVRKGLEKIALFNQEMVLRPDEGGGLIQSTSAQPDLILDRWKAIASVDGKADFLLYEAQGSEEERRMLFQMGADKTLERVVIESSDFIVEDTFERLAWYETSAFQLRLAQVLLVLIGALLLRIPAGLFWLRLKKGAMPPKALHIANLAALGAAFSVFLFLLGLIGALSGSTLQDYTLATPWTLKALLALPICVVLFTILQSVALAFLLLKPNSVTLLSKAQLLLGTAALWAFLWQLHFWNCIGYHG